MSYVFYTLIYYPTIIYNQLDRFTPFEMKDYIKMNNTTAIVLKSKHKKKEFNQ